MVPSSYSPFFTASASGGAALIGLLFVATSIMPHRIFGSAASAERSAVAASAFIAFVNAFFVSLYALIPGANAGGAALFMSCTSLMSTCSVGWQLLRHKQWNGGTKGERLLGGARTLTLVVSSLIVYAIEFGYGWALFSHPGDTQMLSSLATLLLPIYAIGLIRAWELLGGRRNSLLGWLNPLQDLTEGELGSSTRPQTLLAAPTSTPKPELPSAPEVAQHAESQPEAAHAMPQPATAPRATTQPAESPRT